MRRMLFPALTVNTHLAYAGYTEDKIFFSGSLNAGLIHFLTSRYLPLFKFDTRAELKQFETAFWDLFPLDRGYAEVPSFRDATAGYDDAFFAEHSLALVYVSASSSTPRYGLQDVLLSDTYLRLNIVQTNTPEEFPEDKTGWFVLVELLDAEIGHCTSFDAQLELPWVFP